MKKRDTDALLPDCFYHVFVRANQKEILFAKEKNYLFFLRRFSEFLMPIAKTYAYALLENHVHFLIKMRDEPTLTAFCQNLNQVRLKSSACLDSTFAYRPVDPHKVGSYQFQRLFISYAKAFNKQQNRYGNLIQRPFKRRMVTDEAHLFHLVYYIHHNPKKHGVLKDYRAYKWSSYQSFLSNAPTKVERSEALEWFGGREAFVAFHAQYQEDAIHGDSSNGFE